MPALVPCEGAVAEGVALLDVAADDSRWARFYLGEPGFRLAEVAFEDESGEVGLATARLPHGSDDEARAQEGGDDDWFMSLWRGPLWVHGPMPAPAPALPLGTGVGRLRAVPELAALPLPGKKLVRCDGCERDFESAHAWRCHVEGEDGDGDGCPESCFFPTEVGAQRPEPFALPGGAREAEGQPLVFPAPRLLRRMLSAARARDASLLDAILGGSYLADQRTTLREYLEANAEVRSYVLKEGDGDVGLQRWELCPLLRPGPLVVYRGSESRPHGIRCALLQQGAHHTAVAAAFAGGACGTLEDAAECLEEQRRAAWAAPPRCALRQDAASRVRVVFDARLDAHCCELPATALHAALLRLEGPQRTHAALEQLSRSGLLAGCSVAPAARAATEEELRAVHMAPHVNLLLSGEQGGELLCAPQPDGDFFANAHTAGAALLCAGAHADMGAQVASAPRTMVCFCQSSS